MAKLLFTVLIAALFGLSLVNAITVTYGAREDGDELVHENAVVSEGADENGNHVLIYAWGARYGQRFTEVQITPSDSVRMIFLLVFIYFFKIFLFSLTIIVDINQF